MFRDSERSAGGEEVAFDPGVRLRRDRLLVIAIGLLLPALVFGPALLTPEPESPNPSSHLGAERGPVRAEGGGEPVVSSSGWHPAIEHGLGPVGPVSGAGLGRDSGH
jgi:hypothetical protein